MLTPATVAAAEAGAEVPPPMPMAGVETAKQQDVVLQLVDELRKQGARMAALEKELAEAKEREVTNEDEARTRKRRAKRCRRSRASGSSSSCGRTKRKLEPS